MNYGNKVNIKRYSVNGIREKIIIKEELRNVTEIHFNYNKRNSVAFESDIHSTGMTILFIDLIEFETEL
jgi:hypothetical protein